ncbi:hypothetical protein MES5069_750101 [Mesorhizobium escarrei]|uniref:Uncharacterized protein n=1 Tax=Mesorhizobium escarrei TaxID=666018 RepID=A0ABM9EI78_9HYPH|nr:hypothetical protein MES5069_750101 [Mesorhizobium escarrei]
MAGARPCPAGGAKGSCYPGPRPAHWSQAPSGYFVLALGFEPPLPMTEAARDAALLAVATTAPAATLAVVLTVRIALSAIEPPLADFLGLAGFAVVLAAVGVTFFGAALPKLGFASLERAATAGPAPAFDSVAFE